MTSGLSCVAFDLMDTVVADPYREALRASTGRSLADIRAQMDPDAWPAFERGEITEAQYFARFGDIDVDADAFHRARRDGYEILPGIRELLDDLDGQVLRVTASNYPVWVEELADGLLDGCFDRVIASHHLGVRKPDPAFYARLCDELDVTPSAVLFVDDREENVRAARAAGLAAHGFTSATDLRDHLRDAGLEV